MPLISRSVTLTTKDTNYSLRELLVADTAAGKPYEGDAIPTAVGELTLIADKTNAGIVFKGDRKSALSATNYGFDFSAKDSLTIGAGNLSNDINIDSNVVLRADTDGQIMHVVARVI